MKHLLAFIILISTSVVGNASQNINTEADGYVTFYAATSGVTRVSVAGDRIRRIVNQDTQFEMVNDDETGDVFFRYIGENLTVETGYIITEQGITISFQMTPREGVPSQTVILTVKGGPEVSEESRFEVSGGSGDSHASSLTAFVRKIILEKIGSRTPPSPNSRTAAIVMGASGMVGKVYSVKTTSPSPYLRPQTFYKDGVLAVWMQPLAQRSAGRAWVIVVEKR
ncbi:hypothetical protein A9Q96_09970 [Rhodobacterales bacterium 52_120_T64]|nr:hypothetical protein A9Q96_09970 [Rhodobacterales bacterium 52_120_T64]